MTYKERIEEMCIIYNKYMSMYLNFTQGERENNIPLHKAKFREFHTPQDESTVFHMVIDNALGDTFVRYDCVIRKDKTKEDAYKRFYEECMHAAIGQGFNIHRQLRKDNPYMPPAYPAIPRENDN